MSDGGGELAQNRKARGMRKISLHSLITLLAFARSLLSPLAISQIKDKSDALLARSIQYCAANQHWYSITILFQELLFIRLSSAGHPQIG